MLPLILVITGAYALGCIVGAYYIVRLRSGADIRSSGSGTAGARNVMRSGERMAAVLTFAWDAAKGAVAAYFAQRGVAQPWAGGVALIFAVIGHVWPMQLGFRGGKGVATALGGTLMLAMVGQSWPNFAAAGVAWTVVLFAHRTPGTRRSRHT